MKIKTSTKEYSVIWDGVSSLDGLLRFQITGSTMPELLSTFTNAEETAKLDVADSYETIRSYSGYTDFYGIVKNGNGFVITMGKTEG